MFCRREPGANFTLNTWTRICSWHFPNGKHNGPSRFDWNKEKLMRFRDPEERKKSRNSEESSSSSKEAPKIKDNLLLLADACELVQQPVIGGSVSVVMEAELELYKKENVNLRERLKQSHCFKYADIKTDNSKVLLYTTLPDDETFSLIVNLVERFKISYHQNWNVKLMPLSDQILLTLMKLKLNLPHLDLATRFNCSKSTVTNIFQTMVEVFHIILFQGCMEKNVPSRQKNQKDLPKCFNNFQNCRMVLDCTEIGVAKSENLSENCLTYSNYKGRNTLKGLVGIAPNGVITFASSLYGGNTSDKAITQDCGVLDIFNVGDLVLADKGFTIGSILPPGVTLNHPSFLYNGQFSKQEVVLNKEISRARIHVERAIQRVKLFSILSHIPYQYKHLSSKLFQVACCLTNFQTPIISEGRK